MSTTPAHQIDKLFDEVTGGEPGAVLPMVDVLRGPQEVVVRADMPGVKSSDVRIEVSGDVLTLRGTHEAPPEDHGRAYVRRERRYGSFVRHLALPAGVEADRISATCDNGVVEVTVPLPDEGRDVVRIRPRPA